MTGSSRDRLCRCAAATNFGVRLVNGLSEPTALHWHGVRLANAMDGAPPLTQAPVAPGESFDYRFVAPDAGTYWYHPPRPTRHGLYGVLVVTEAEPVDVDRDVTLIFDQGTAGPDAVPFTVNGTSQFDIRARRNERLRLRLLNASASQILALHIDGLRTFVMATDGEPAEPFAARDGRLALGPGNRIDVFVDCTLDAGRLDAGRRGFCRCPDPDRPYCLRRRTAEPAGAARRIRSRCRRTRCPSAWISLALSVSASAIGKDPANGAKSTGPLFSVKRGRTVVLGASPIRLEKTASSICMDIIFGCSMRSTTAGSRFGSTPCRSRRRRDCRIAFVADNPGKWLIEGLAKDGAAEAWFEVT